MAAKIPHWVAPGVTVVYDAYQGYFGGAIDGTIAIEVTAVTASTVTERVAETSTGGVETGSETITITPGTGAAWGFQFWVNSSVTSPPYEIETADDGIYAFQGEETYDNVAATSIGFKTSQNGVVTSQSDVIYENANGLILAMGDDFIGGEYTYYLASDNLPSSPAAAPAASDFNGDGKSDILFLDPNGALAMWVMNNTAIVGGGVFETLGPGWTVSGIGDFNGDGKSDILLSTAAGALAIWEMNGTTVAGGGPVGALGAGWSVAGVGDFNGDGLADILFQNTSGALGMWEMNGAQIIGGSSAFEDLGANSGWRVAGVGDFNGDGEADILLANANGAVALWEMNGAAVAGGGVFENLGVGSGWTVAGVGDFNGDGAADVLLENANGAVAMWEMNGTSVIGGGVFENLGAGSGWSVAGVGDYNGDGRADILLHNTSGATQIWDMNGAQVVGGGPVGSIPSPWIIEHV